jgi:hypothetical protein
VERQCNPSSAVSAEGLTERGWKKGSGLGAKGEGVSAVALSRKCLVLQGQNRKSNVVCRVGGFTTNSKPIVKMPEQIRYVASTYVRTRRRDS